MSLPNTMKVRLKSADTVIQAIGTGSWTTVMTSGYGAPTTSRVRYELFYPRGVYYLPTIPPTPPAVVSTPLYQEASSTTNGYFNYPLSSSGSIPETMKVTVYPDQMTAFGSLYKYARIERVDFIIRFANLGASSLGAAQSVASQDKYWSSANINHTSLVVPYAQYNDWGAYKTPPSYPGQAKWDQNSAKSDHIAGQVSEMPGSVRLTTSQDGNREIVTFRGSYDLTQRMAGDSVRQRTWMSSLVKPDANGNIWVIPDVQDDDPQLAVIGTSPLIDERRESLPANASAADNNVWLRWAQHVAIQNHLTFWEPKSPIIDVSTT